MPTLLTVDLHLSDNPRDSYRLAFLESLPDTCKRRDVDHVIILGDLTEEKDRHGAWLVNKIVDAIATLAKDVRVSFLRGNHDYIEVDHPFFRLLGRLERVSYVTEPTILKSSSVLGGEARGRVVFLPHTSDHQRDWRGITFKRDDWIFCHQTFNGADAGFGKTLKGIPGNIFPETAKVYAGDIHVPQKLGQITYIGAPYTIDFGDSYQPRYLIIDGEKVTSIKRTTPGKRLIDVPYAHELFLHLDYHMDYLPGDILKIRINLTHDEYQEWPRIKKDVLKWGEEKGLQIHTVQPVVALAAVNQRKRDDTAQTDMELLEEYAKHRGVDDRTLKTGRIIMEGT